ncbi:MAG TPA: hypothetical protein VH374_06100 [Polyangia bacterium]|nr:hypothetical protein [Polyangia bacterium]
MKRTRMMTLTASGCILGWAAMARAAEPTQPPPQESPTAGVAAETDVDEAPPAVTPAPAPAPPAPVMEPITPVQPMPAQLPVTAPPRDVDTSAMYGLPVGGAILVGGGYEDFTNSNLRSMTAAGGTWTARAIVGTREFVGLEAAYVGSSHSINTLGVGSNANLISNGIEGALRLNVPVINGLSLFEPFGFVGLGWQHYSINNGSATSDIAGNDDIMTLPFGGGLEFAYRMFMADARFTYRETYYNDLLRTSGGRLNNWGVGGQVGMAF